MDPDTAMESSTQAPHNPREVNKTGRHHHRQHEHQPEADRHGGPARLEELVRINPLNRR